MKLFVSVLYVAVIGIISFYVGLALPRHMFHEDRFPYKPFKWEKDGKIYGNLNVRKWENKVPDMSRVSKKMVPKKLPRKTTSHDIDVLIKETCVAEAVHRVLSIASIGIYFFWRSRVGVLLSFLSVLGNLPYILIQRYNRPKLILLRDRLREREERVDASADIVV